MKKQDRTIYDDSSSFYEELINTFRADFEYYNTLLQVLKPTSILEIGCGCGRLFGVYEKYCNDVVGVDLSEELVKLAHKKFPNVKVVIGDIISFNLDRDFDLIVISNSLLKHIERNNDRVQVLKNVIKHLSNKGVVSIDHSDYLYYEDHTTDWVNADQTIAAKWFPNENGILSQVQWRKRVFGANDNLSWRRITKNGYASEIEYSAFQYSIIQLQSHLSDVGLYYERLLTDYDKEGLLENGKRFISIAGLNKQHLATIKKQFIDAFSLI